MAMLPTRQQPTLTGTAFAYVFVCVMAAATAAAALGDTSETMMRSDQAKRRRQTASWSNNDADSMPFKVYSRIIDSLLSTIQSRQN